MTFLALSTFQAAALAIVTSAIIVAMYFLKVRHRRVVVASSVLWRRVLLERRVDSLWEHLRQLLSVALAVVIGLLIVFALARPQVGAMTVNAQRVVIVLDTSPTMLARTSDGRTRWQRAADSANSLLDRGTEVRVIDTSGRFDSAFTGDHEAVRTLIAQMHPDVSSGRFPDVNPGDAQTYFISDGVSALNVPKGVTRVSVFEKAANVGIAAFEIRAMPSTPDKYEAYIDVHNYGSTPRNTRISLTGSTGQPIVRAVSLDPEQSFKEPFDLSQFGSGTVRATVQSDGDAFPADDVAYGYLPAKKKTRTLLVTAGNKYLETMLKLDSFIDLSTANPEGFHDGGNFDAYIFDRFAPQAAPSKPALIIGVPSGVPGAAWLPPSRGVVHKPVLKSWLEDHPAMHFVSLYDVSIDTATDIDASNLTVIASSEKTPLIVASGTLDRPQWIMLTFDLQNSDFAFHSAFPLFVDNVIAWFGREPEALYRTSGVIELPFANAQVKNAGGTVVPSREHMGHTVFETAETGLYVATQGNAQQVIAVNFASPQYSDINRTAKNGTGAATTNARWLTHELWFYLLITALVLLFAEWFTYHRRRTL